MLCHVILHHDMVCYVVLFVLSMLCYVICHVMLYYDVRVLHATCYVRPSVCSFVRYCSSPTYRVLSTMRLDYAMLFRNYFSFFCLRLLFALLLLLLLLLLCCAIFYAAAVANCPIQSRFPEPGTVLVTSDESPIMTVSSFVPAASSSSILTD